MTPRTIESPSISCVIPAFNEAGNLGAAAFRILVKPRSISQREGGGLRTPAQAPVYGNPSLVHQEASLL
nr:hypothetical protein [Rhodoferax sp.]